MKFEMLAEKVLSGAAMSREEGLAILGTSAEDMLALLQAAFTVRERHFARKVRLHFLVNAKSGLCAEDCTYCSQAAVSQAEIERYPLLGDGDLLKGAREAKKARARRYCIVTSGLRPEPDELESLCRAVRLIRNEVGIDICVSAGLLREEEARRLSEAGVKRYNHNLNTSEGFYPHICTTHSYGDRMATLTNARKAGLELCCGALLGMGEGDADRVELALALREIGPDSIPVNFYHPIEGTLLEQVQGTLPVENRLTPFKCLAILCLMRLLNPAAELRIAGGREHHLRSLQALALYPANSIFVGGYLTVSGQTPEDAWQMVEDAGFEVEEESFSEVATRLQDN